MPGVCENTNVGNKSKSSNSSFNLADVTRFFAGAIASVLLAEVILHAIELSPLWRILPIVERELGLPDPQLGYKFKSSYKLINVRENRAQIFTNSQGMRDQQRTIENPHEDHIVAFMGDSYTEALQVSLQDTFVYQTEELLNQTANDANIQALNFGMSGAGPLQQLIRHELDATKFEPDLSIFVIGVKDFLSPELVNDSSGPAYVKAVGTDELQIGRAYRNLITHRIQSEWYGKFFFWLMDYSRVTRALFLQYRVGKASAQPPGRNISRVSCAGALKALEPYDALWRKEEPKPHFSRWEKFLSDTDRADINEAVFAFYGLYHPPSSCSDALARRTLIVSSIRARLRAQNIGLIDLDKGIAALDERFYLSRAHHGFGSSRGIGHLNIEGHRLYARLLSTEIQKLMIRPKP